MNVVAHQEKNEKTSKRETGKEKNSRSILEKLRAAPAVAQRAAQLKNGLY